MKKSASLWLGHHHILWMVNPCMLTVSAEQMLFAFAYYFSLVSSLWFGGPYTRGLIWNFLWNPKLRSSAFSGELLVLCSFVSWGDSLTLLFCVCLCLPLFESGIWTQSGGHWRTGRHVKFLLQPGDSEDSLDPLWVELNDSNLFEFSDWERVIPVRWSPAMG